MPIVNHSALPMPPPVDRVSERALVSSEHGVTSFSVKEVVVHPGSLGRLHTHPTDQAIMVTAGAMQMIVGGDVQTARAGYTLVAPAGEPHKLINNLWVAATLLVIDSTDNLDTNFLED